MAWRRWILFFIDVFPSGSWLTTSGLKEGWKPQEKSIRARSRLFAPKIRGHSGQVYLRDHP